MPELPEVEFSRQCLERWLKGRRLLELTVPESRVLRGASPQSFSVLEGATLLQVRRHGKLLCLQFERELGLLSHLGMTGKWLLSRVGEEAPSHSRARFTREDGAVIHYQDPRMFGWLKVGSWSELLEDRHLRSLGPDAWDAPLSSEELHNKIRVSRRNIKDLLMDQSILAGLGNIQVTEALFRARVSPILPGKDLSREQVESLLEAISWTLKRTLADLSQEEGIAYLNEAKVPNPFVVYQRAGEPCPRCGTKLESIRISGRSTVFCPHCQRGEGLLGRGEG